MTNFCQRYALIVKAFHSVSPADRRPDKMIKPNPQAITSIISQTYGNSHKRIPHIARRIEPNNGEERKAATETDTAGWRGGLVCWRHSHIQYPLEYQGTKESKKRKKPVLGPKPRKRTSNNQYKWGQRPGEVTIKFICPDISTSD